MAVIGLIVVLAAIDLFIKRGIEEQEDSAFPRELNGTNGKVMLYKNHNQGFPFGFLKDKPELVRLVPLTVFSFLSGMTAWLLTQKGRFVEKLAAAVLLGGALSNLYDRLVRNYVVDYFSFQWRGLKKVVFNLGDMFIFLGSGMLLILEALRSFKRR